MSTEFNIGLGAKCSSKVLRPPGGGSSNIFGTDPIKDSAVSEEVSSSNSEVSADLETSVNASEILDDSENVANSCDVASSKTELETVPVVPKKFIYRNPITGEGYETQVKETPEKFTEDNYISEKAAEDLSKPEPSKVVHTSIRIRNPPGGKSSGIF